MIWFLVVLSGEKDIMKKKGAKYMKYELTPKEKEVYNYAVMTSYSKSAIAAKMKVAKSTIDTHFIHIFEKIGVTNRYQLIIEHYKKIYKEVI